jgi:hypothetical protein
MLKGIPDKVDQITCFFDVISNLWAGNVEINPQEVKEKNRKDDLSIKVQK